VFDHFVFLLRSWCLSRKSFQLFFECFQISIIFLFLFMHGFIKCGLGIFWTFCSLDRLCWFFLGFICYLPICWLSFILRFFIRRCTAYCIIGRRLLLCRILRIRLFLCRWLLLLCWRCILSWRLLLRRWWVLLCIWGWLYIWLILLSFGFILHWGIFSTHLFMNIIKLLIK